jgi:hypothetical protein
MEYEPSNPEELDAIAEYAYEIAETTASEYLEVRPVGVILRVEEGSVETIVTIGSYAAALLSAISNYGGFWDGISRIKEHAQAVGRFVCNRILKRIKAQGVSRVSTGQLGELHRLFRKVEAGELTADEATEKSFKIMVKAGEEISEQLQDMITKEFAQIRVASSEERASQKHPALTEHRATGEGGKARPKRRVRRRGVEIWRNPEEHTKNKRYY